MRSNLLNTEEELVQLLKNGDEDAFSEIYNRYWEKLLHVAFFHTHDKQAAEDIVHDVLLSLWMRKSELQIESLNAYLAKAVKFAVFKKIMRGKRRRELLSAQTQPKEVTDIEEKLEAKFLKELLEKTIDCLPEKTQLIFSYSRVEGMSIAEISHKTDLSPKAVEYHITKAIKALRNQLQKIKSFFV